MTNLAYKQTQETARENNVSYIDFAAHAARRTEKHRKQALCLQHRYGALLLALCFVCICISLATSFTDLTALLVLAPLGVYLLLTKSIIVYHPARHH